jgi:hypothetical protein
MIAVTTYKLRINVLVAALVAGMISREMICKQRHLMFYIPEHIWHWYGINHYDIDIDYITNQQKLF